MITVTNLSLSYGTQVLFKDVNIKFTSGNCYGVIGANGAGKSTFLKILSGEIEADGGTISITPGERLATLKQDHFMYNNYKVLDTVIMGYEKLYRVMKERESIYEKPDFSEEDGIRASELESEFAELGGWEAESEAASLLNDLGIKTEYHDSLMSEIEDSMKVRVLLAQSLFGNPDILLLDEPTNHLDLQSIAFLENFLMNFNNTVIVVSHDRHFLNTVCTHIVDIDFDRVQLYVGNYDFWYMSSQLALRQAKDEKKRAEEKIAELKEFIQRFSSNVAKARQATSRKKLIEKLTLDDIKPSKRRFPYVYFKPEREIGNNVLDVEDLILKTKDDVVLKNYSMRVEKGDKIAFVGPLHALKTAFFETIVDKEKPESGEYKWGVTTKVSYFPKNNDSEFNGDDTILEWLSRYAGEDADETYLRSFLGRMLFSGDEVFKKCSVLSGGERVRCVLSKMMLEGANVLIFDEPTSHLDLEAIQALNNALIEFKGVILFNSHDHQFVDSTANRIIEFAPHGVIDRRQGFDAYMSDAGVNALRNKLGSSDEGISI